MKLINNMIHFRYYWDARIPVIATRYDVVVIKARLH